ncbi:HK97 family phage prohead protease [Dermabacteraceae bacterium CCM 9519]
MKISGEQLRSAPPAAIFRVTDTNDEKREITGVAVPWGEIFEMRDYGEQFAPGSITDEGARAFYEHGELIGLVTASQDTDEGREITMRLSDTARGRDVYTLARDGALRGLSIGCTPIEWTEQKRDNATPLVTITRAEAFEYSLVAFPAYRTTKLTQIRSDRKDTPKMDTSTAPADVLTRSEFDASVTDLTNQLADMRRSLVDVSSEPSDALIEAGAQFRSIGEYVAAAADPDSSRYDAARAVHRAITTSDIPEAIAQTPGWIGDLTRKVTERRRWTQKFARKSLPAKGMTVDYVKRDIKLDPGIAKQATENTQVSALGATWESETASAPVETYAGGDTFSLQFIKRSPAEQLTELFTAAALDYARKTELATKTFMKAQIQDRITKHTSESDKQHALDMSSDWAALDWVETIMTAGGVFEDRGYTLQELTVSADVFVKMAKAEATDGRPLLNLHGSGVNTVGTLNVTAGSGNLLGMPVTVLHGAEANTALFFDPIALETRESEGAPLWIQEDHALTLSRDYACYGFMAHLAPHPTALLPVKFA